ncbi:hypothetical protein Br6_05253 [Rhodococcus sp. Br-6]|nr:hypothetical protein Br6_05253 [Rhodococcus sp. Br-6]
MDWLGPNCMMAAPMTAPYTLAEPPRIDAASTAVANVNPNASGEMNRSVFANSAPARPAGRAPIA